MRTMQEWLESYSRDHQNPVNQRLHWLCVPPIVWAVIALLWAVLVMVLAFYWYWRRSHRLALALLVALALLGLLAHLLYLGLGPRHLCYLAVGVFVVAWVGQFVGHHYEGHRPSFFTDVSYLLIGPAWLMEKLLRKLGFGVST